MAAPGRTNPGRTSQDRTRLDLTRPDLTRLGNTIQSHDHPRGRAIFWAALWTKQRKDSQGQNKRPWRQKRPRQKRSVLERPGLEPLVLEPLVLEPLVLEPLKLAPSGLEPSGLELSGPVLLVLGLWRCGLPSRRIADRLKLMIANHFKLNWLSLILCKHHQPALQRARGQSVDGCNHIACF